MFEWPIRVYYEDTDAGGVVYHAQYVAFYERARTEYLRVLNIHQQQLFNDNIAFVVRNISVDYKLPAHLDDSLRVESQITHLKRASLVFEQSIYNEQGVLLNRAEVLVACVSLREMKPVAIPNNIASLLSSRLINKRV